MRALHIAAAGMAAQELNVQVIANNIANVNTAGFKSDNTLFEEYLNTPAHEDNFIAQDRRSCSRSCLGCPTSC